MGLVKKKKHVLLLNLFYACILVILNGCGPSNEENQETEKWTSTDPLAVAYRVRHNKFLQGNLIQNPSFEIGRIKKNNTPKSQVIIDGWEILGKDVRWIDATSFSGFENNLNIHSGQRAICIQREYADETEIFGQGVLSDYIKVIPGNYRFNLYLKLKEIKNPKSRMGTKIYDAIDLRVLFYDRNKLQIKGDQYSTYLNQRIDCSFKGVSFSNYENIDSTGWLHINGHSQVFPFPDGDIPDETKYVKIFIGLKGTGTLWADDISFSYTNQNFTTLERVSKFFDSTFAKAKLILPQPKTVQILESKLYYRADHPDNFPIILLPKSTDKLTLNSAKILERKITDLLIAVGKVEKGTIPSLIRYSKDEISTPLSLLFSIGENDLYEKYKNELPLQKILAKEQGYFIHSINSIPHIIFVKGNSPEANYYAFQSLIQLFDNKNLMFHNANIIDYPSKESRALLIADKISGYTDSSNINYLRFNRLYLPDIQAQYEPKDYTDLPVQKILYFTISHNLNSTILDQIGLSIKQSSKLFNCYAFIFSDALSHDINFNNALFSYNNPDCFSIETMTKFSDYFNFLINKGESIEIMPPFTHYENGTYQNCNETFSSLFIDNNKGAGFLWSGFELFSWQIDEPEINKVYANKGIRPGFIDFSLYPRSQAMQFFGNDTINPYKILTSCLFEPYSNEIVNEVYAKTGTNVLVYSNSNIFDRIRIKTASDFYWNSENFNPDFSLFKALVSEFGIEASYEIIKWNDLYFKARSELILASNKKNFHKNVRKAYQTINELNKVDKLLKTRYTNDSVKELSIIFANLINELEQMKSDLGYIPIIK